MWEYPGISIEPTDDAHIPECQINLMQFHSQAEWYLYYILISC